MAIFHVRESSSHVHLLHYTQDIKNEEYFRFSEALKTALTKCGWAIYSIYQTEAHELVIKVRRGKKLETLTIDDNRYIIITSDTIAASGPLQVEGVLLLCDREV
ncbi:MAG: hypothetical protein NC489_08320 [Ruminococcus flavefaciens]|nr:hypothetical protein [Ruminococcus flavefaciens]